MGSNDINLGNVADESDITSIYHLQMTFLISIVVFVFSLPCLTSRKSFSDAISTRKVLTFMRLVIFLETVANAILFYFVMGYGQPFSNQYTSYGNGSSWIYGYGRPVVGLVFVAFGGIADMHPTPRYICLLICLEQLVCDAFSAFQVRDYIRQIENFDAPVIGQYSVYVLEIYYWRDIISFGLCTLLFMLTAHVTSILGLCQPPFLNYQNVEGQDLDRVGMMQKNQYIQLHGIEKSLEKKKRNDRGCDEPSVLSKHKQSLKLKSSKQSTKMSGKSTKQGYMSVSTQSRLRLEMESPRCDDLSKAEQSV
jgi:hypothetical protein